MFELTVILSVLGLGLAIDFIASEDDDIEEPPIELALTEDQIRFDGSEAREHVTGNAMNNIFIGDNGNDHLATLAGDDTLDGGAGNDRLFAGDGDDIAIGGSGADRIFLGDGDDSTAPPLLDGQDAGDDFIRGGAGADNLFDTRGSNEIFGDLGNDRITTIDAAEDNETGTADTVHAGFGNDTLVGDDGDILTGGKGDDRFIVATSSTAPGAPVVVTDFDLRDDLFSVVYLQEIPGDDTVTFAFDPTTNLIHALLEGREVATLQGLTAADIPFINTFVTTMPDLMTAEI